MRPAILAILAALASSACIATGVRVNAGAVAYGDRVGFQVGALAGIGITRSHRNAWIGHTGFVTGDAPTAGLVSALEYVHLPDDDGAPISLRGGVAGTVALAGDPMMSSLVGGAMVVLRERGGSWEGHEKFGGGGWSRSVMGLGLELRGGIAFVQTPESTPEHLERLPHPGGSVSLTWEWLSIGETSFF